MKTRIQHYSTVKIVIMRSILVVLSLAVAALAAPSQYEPVWTDYHQEFGIAQAARIKAIEEALDFDGNRIAGGSPAFLGQYPFLGGLIVLLANNQQSVCGSSLLSHNRLVTAAHCWRHGNSLARHFTVVLGSVRLFSGGVRINTNQVEIHPHYNPNNFNNDLAIIRIVNVAFSANINRISLPVGNEQYVGVAADVAGFGRTGDGVGIGQNQVLSHVRVPVITNAECQRTFGPGGIIASVICTSGIGGRSPCPGDSGGPLRIAVTQTLIGVVSFGSALGCTRGFPVAYMRMTSFAAWIRARL